MAGLTTCDLPRSPNLVLLYQKHTQRLLIGEILATFGFQSLSRFLFRFDLALFVDIGGSHYAIPWLFGIALAPHMVVGVRTSPGHVVDFRLRPQILGGIAMAIQTPLHLQRVLGIHDRHLIDAAMATGAANTLGDMDFMAEVNKVRQVVYAGPPERAVFAHAGAHRLEQLGIGPDLGVTVDTGPSRRNAGKARFLHRGVTVLAVQTQSADVVL